MKRNGLTPGVSSGASEQRVHFGTFAHSTRRRTRGSQYSREVPPHTDKKEQGRPQRGLQGGRRSARYRRASSTAATRPPENPAPLAERDVIRDVAFAVTAWRKRVRAVLLPLVGSTAGLNGRAREYSRGWAAATLSWAHRNTSCEVTRYSAPFTRPNRRREAPPSAWARDRVCSTTYRE